MFQILYQYKRNIDVKENIGTLVETVRALSTSDSGKDVIEQNFESIRKTFIAKEKLWNNFDGCFGKHAFKSYKIDKDSRVDASKICDRECKE